MSDEGSHNAPAAVIPRLVRSTCGTPPIPVGMADRNQDDLNALSRKGVPDLLEAALRGTNQAYAEAARPTADLVLPSLSEPFTITPGNAPGKMWRSISTMGRTPMLRAACT